jgi:hypothetical protein
MAIDPGPQLTARNLVLTPIGLLALALLAVELLAGIQTYLTSTVTPPGQDTLSFLNLGQNT